jgi:hypothetical protein
MYSSLTFFLIIFVTFCVPLINSIVASVNGSLFENGTCTNEKVNETYKQELNINGTVDDFLKSLPSDNTILAQIVCQSNSNDTTLR